jgi:hypothetical protein
VNDHRWLDDAEGEAETDLRDGLEEARNRLPDEVTLRRLWGKIAAPEVEHPARARWRWFVGGVISSAALGVTLAVCLWPGRGGIGSGFGQSGMAARPAKPGVTGTPTGAGTVRGKAVAAPVAEAGPLASPPFLVTPATVRTGARETLRLTLRGGIEAQLDRASVMNVDAKERPTIEKGQVAFSVPHQPPGQSFTVAAAGYRILVVGTKFRLHVEGSRVGVDVDEGVVEIWGRRRLARLVPGESWSGPSRVIAAARVPGPATAPVVAASPFAADPALAARAALAAGEPQRALDLYRSIAARGGPGGENAEYEIGRLLRDQLGQPGNALAAWRRYRSLHPDGLLRVETDVSIIETLVSSGDSSAALGEANDFLVHHPESERRAEIARVLGDLYRSQGDCRRALGAYQTALTARRTKDIADYASFHRAGCLVSLNQPEGSAALETYLQVWPSGRFRDQARRLLGRTPNATNDQRADGESTRSPPQR